MGSKTNNLRVKNLIIKSVLAILLVINFTSFICEAASRDPKFLTFTDVDRATFNEYGYKITRQFFRLQENFAINESIDTAVASEILETAKIGFNYLPDNLKNEDYLYKLSTAIQKGIKNPNNESYYTDIVGAIGNFLNKTEIKSIEGTIEVFPREGNSPLTVTLKGSVQDPSGSNLSDYNYTWWLDKGGKREIIGGKPTIKYTFTKEGNISVFLEVKSNHRNSKGLTDVLPFKGSTIIDVNTKIASLVLNVNGENLKKQNILKVSPLEASYGLTFDATSSTPTEGTIFEETTWDFGNGVKRSYKGGPKIERVIYSSQGDFNVSLKLKTNQGKIVEKNFQIFIHKPIATIHSSLDEGFLGDKFLFSAKTASKDKALTYLWEIIDIDNDKIIYKKTGQTFSYSFTKKGKFNIKLKIKNSAGDTDIDNKIIYINSKDPVANFLVTVPKTSQPDRILLDGSKSYDPDFLDDGKLKYIWIIDGQRITLNNSNIFGSVGYYSFNSTGEHSISLEVIDNDGISNIKKGNVYIKSILDVDFTPFPKVIERNGFVKFISKSSEAKIYEWNFGDGEKEGGNKKNITHYFKESGSFNVVLKVRDKQDNSNTISKVVYVSESNEPFAIIEIENLPVNGGESNKKSNIFKENQCEGEGAYIMDRTMSIIFNGGESINTDGTKKGLKYTWKIGNGKLFSDMSINYKYDEIGCHKVKLTVTNTEKGKSNSTDIWLKVENIKPELKSLNLLVKDLNADPIIVTAVAIGAKDRDGIVQSYLWYYYTDTDNEPQGFRSTRTSSTTFVLPKIAGNYFFSLIMKDNNGEKTESKKGETSITVSGDNINTPLITVTVDDSSVSTGQKVVFTTKVENILGHNLSNKATYSWDFDGDGFYDTETTNPEVVYAFKKSGEFHAKVKVKFKGFSNTKSTTINVANQLIPDFEYISIGNKYIFFNNSTGTISNILWDMGNGDKIRGKNYFTYTYKTKETSHKVKLTISEGNKTKNKEKRIVKNPKNILKARKNGINIFSIPELGTEKTIILKKESDNLFLYLGESKGEIEYFPIDYDLSYDSDLNGGKDDDEDNKGKESYTSGAPLSIPLNKKREQEVRITLKDINIEPIESIDIKIIKEYIEEDEEIIDEGSIYFTGVTDSEKEIIAEIKNLVSSLPNEYKQESLGYISKLQEEWNDPTEKTRTILDFEEYLDTTNSNQKDTIIDLLESLLVDGEIEKTESKITLNALKSLLPENISCNDTGEFRNCYEYLLDKLEQISNSNDIEKNKALGTDILEVISKQGEDIISVKQGYDFKAILKSLIYGSTSEIPLCEEGEVNTELCRSLEEQPLQNEDNIEKESSSILKTLIKWILWLLLLGGGSMFVYFIYYKLTNKNSDSGFEDFIMEKTNPDNENESEDGIDVLGGMETDKEKNNDNNSGELDKTSKDTLEDTKESTPGKSKIIEKNNDIFSDNTISNEKNKEVKKDENKKDEKVPSWLNLDNGKTDKKDDDIFAGIEDKDEKENKTEKVKKDEVKKPEKIDSTKQNNKKISEKTNNSKNNIKKEEVFDEIEEDNTPDWLKGSFSNNTKKEDNSNEKTKIEVNINNNPKGGKGETKKVENKSNKVNNTRKEDIPDWLKNNEFNTDKPKKEDNKGDTPDWLKNNEFDIKEDTKKSKKIDEPKKEENTSDWLKNNDFNTNKDTKKSKKIDKVGESINGKSIDVPNWLESDTIEKEQKDKTEIKEIKKAEEVKKEEISKPLKEDSLIKENTEIEEVEEKTKNVKSIKTKTLEIDLSPDTPKKDTPKSKGKEDMTNKNKDSGKDKKESTKKDNTDKENEKKEKINADMELWDDGMKVPDWLKTDDKNNTKN